MQNVTTAAAAAGLASPPDPRPDRPGKPVPERIAEILAIACILAEYGRHLAATIEHRAIWRGFATIAQFFGTAAIPRILPYLQRGIMRAVALHRVLSQRAARGRDLVVLARRDRSRREPPPQPQAALTVGTEPATPPAFKRSRHVARADLFTWQSFSALSAPCASQDRVHA